MFKNDFVVSTEGKIGFIESMIPLENAYGYEIIGQLEDVEPIHTLADGRRVYRTSRTEYTKYYPSITTKLHYFSKYKDDFSSLVKDLGKDRACDVPASLLVKESICSLLFETSKRDIRKAALFND